jgi:hypothetical protein
LPELRVVVILTDAASKHFKSATSYHLMVKLVFYCNGETLRS